MFNDKAQLLKVFVDEDGNFGDLASVVIDEGEKISDRERQLIAKELNTGETVFINNIDKANISVMHPQGEIDFAGVGVLGAAWFLSKLHGKPIQTLHGRKGEITFRQEGSINWTQAKKEIMPPWNFKQVVSAREVEKMMVEYTKHIIHTMYWAWIDKEKGLIRARTFANDWEIPEAEGNGSGAMLLAAKLDREIQIVHGKGSLIFAKPDENNSVGVGGRVVGYTT